MRWITTRLGSGRALFLGLVAVCTLAGCGTTDRSPDVGTPILFPPPPEKPRLQFLTALSGPEDLGAQGPSGFEKFVLGEVEQREGVATPYGVAIHDGKIYVCDVGRRRVEVLDLAGRSFGYLTEDRRLMNPVNLYIEPDGTKYVADPTAGAVFVFDAGNALQSILGRDQKIRPIDVVVRGPYCYVTDFASNQVVVLDKATGREVRRIGEEGEKETQFKMISDLSFGPEGDLYVTDKLKAKIYQFAPSGELKRTIGRLGDNIDELVRPKGVAVDDQGRIWVVDASTEVAKIYDQQGRLLLFFGRPGNEPGRMNLPAKIVLDYDNVGLFRRYAVKGADIRFLVLVSSQYGPNKVNVYGFGEFPDGGRPAAVAQQPQPPRPEVARPVPPQDVEPPAARSQAEMRAEDIVRRQRMKEVADTYYRSMTLYRAGQYQEARAGFLEVIASGMVPAAMEGTLKGYIRDIDARLAGAGGGR